MKKYLFRVFAIACGLSAFVVVEFVCLIFNYGGPEFSDDPFVGFSKVHSLFVADETGHKFHIPKSRRKFFADESFPAKKLHNEFRIFCLGGSTVQGRPFSKETSFTTWLEIALRTADRSRKWDVINCGGISYASYRLVPILQECLFYKPDLFVICMGHNEYLEDRTYEPLRQRTRLLMDMHKTLSSFRSYFLFRSAWFTLGGSLTKTNPDRRPMLKDDVDVILNYENGLQAYHRDEQWYADVRKHFQHNLVRMISIAKSAGIPVILIKPPVNLCDCPPFKSQHRSRLTNSELITWDVSVKKARSVYQTNLQEAIKHLRQATAIDDQYALTWYELGKCYEEIKEAEKARDAYLRARDFDVCPLRIRRPMEQILTETARKTNTPLIDAHALLEQQTKSGILGDNLLIDHVHPSATRGHQEIANEITAEMKRHGWLHPNSDWQQSRDAKYVAHLASLNDTYFLRGRRTLDSLHRWSQGRAKGPKWKSKDMQSTTNETGNPR